MSSLNEAAGHGVFGPGAAQGAPGGTDLAGAELLGEAGGLSRRRLLQVMGASLALSTAAGCRFEPDEILPFQKRPEGRIPGTTRRFATAYETAGFAASLLVTSYDGRPIKVEGNPLHPIDRGAASARSQASVLDLYDPDHSRGLVQQDRGVAYPRAWKEFDAFFARVLESAKADGGATLRVLAAPSSSATLAGLRARFEARFPRARWIEWSAISRTQELAGARLAFGAEARAILKPAAARTLVALDADLLGDHPAALLHARELAGRRDPASAEMARLWAVEPAPTLTGAAADHRLALRVEQVHPFLAALEARVEAALGRNGARQAQSGGFLARPEVERFLSALAAELVERRGESLIAVGRRQPAAVHALAHRLNATLENAGRTVVYVDEPPARDPASALAELVGEMEGGGVATLVVLGANPHYDAPADVDFRRALRKVALSIHLGTARDETARACTWHLPMTHALEAWGDALSWDGTRCVQQPLIDPIFERRSAIEFSATLAGEAVPARELVRAAILPGAADDAWRQAVHDGFVANSAPAGRALAIQTFELAPVEARAMEDELASGRMELALAPDPKVHDGSLANNSWLQELPDAITKMTWGNAAWISPSTAARLSVRDASIVVLRAGGRELRVAACVVPGHADGSVTLHLGHGRVAAGLVGGLEDDGVESVGFDAYRLRTLSSLEAAHDLAVEATGEEYALARTTDPAVEDHIGGHGRDERLPELLREFAHAAAAGHGAGAGHGDKAEPQHGMHHPALESLWEHEAPGAVRWGMAIDLNACIGCNACVVACQAENNVPVVGREQVKRGREMHWIRIDRYFTGPETAPRVRFQPLTCQHCESAPCEQVCPVAATVHSAEGLNDMVYNRCIGTRYCGNNCPFKVRKFNYFHYNRALAAEGGAVQRMRVNPEVTVRPRGVMEKCTFCVQRIQRAKIAAKNEGRTLADGEIVSACAATCPTSAIVFGDLADRNSRVAALAADGRAYRMLEELNIRPRTSYLAKATNREPKAELHDG